MDFLKSTTLLVLFTFYSVAAAPTKCGKQTLRINFGQSKNFTSPDLATPSSCKYRIKAPKGFDIKLTYIDFNSEPCCSRFEIYNAAKRPFRWLSKQILEKPTDVLPGTVVQYQTHMLGVKHDITTPGEPKVSFTYEAVVPKDGNCGFRTYASKSEKLIGSPGFPRTSKSGLRCSWIIKSKDEKPIVLTLTGLNTVSVSDYVNVYEGDRRIGLHVGTLATTNPTEHIVYSGKMRVYFHTTTSQSIGFKATYKTLEVNSTGVVEGISGSMGREESTGMKCHQRSKVSLMGRIRTDTHSTIICPAGSKCSYMIMEGMFHGITVRNENANCIPANMCIDNVACNMHPPPLGITVKPCEVTCCSTNMCNESPDGPPASTGLGASPGLPITPRKITQCDFTTEILGDDGQIMASSSPGDCTPDTVCVLYRYTGIETGEFNRGKKVTGAAAKCGFRTECTREACNHIQESKFIDIKSCQVSCCETDYCNDVYKFGGLRPGSTVPPIGDGGMTPIVGLPLLGLRCDQSSEIEIGKMRLGSGDSSDCPPYTICALFRYEGPATDPDVPGTIATGYTAKCTPRSQCNREACNNINEAKYVDIKTCNVTCCETDFCNNGQPTIAPPASRTPPMPYPEATGLDCIQSSDVYAGDRSVSGRNWGFSCPVDTVCALYTFWGISTQLDGSIIPASGYSAKCAPESACNREACDDLYEAKHMKFISCDVKCCETARCNKPPPPPDSIMPTISVPTPVNAGGDKEDSDEGRQCYDLLQVEGPGMQIPGGKKIKSTCVPGSDCLKITAIATHDLIPSMEITTTYGSCIPSIVCNSIDCSNLISAIANATIRSCDVSCCSTDFCNG